MNDHIVELRRGGLVLSTDRSRIDIGGTLAMPVASHCGRAMRQSSRPAMDSARTCPLRITWSFAPRRDRL